jgi:hypothetical protein
MGHYLQAISLTPKKQKKLLPRDLISYLFEVFRKGEGLGLDFFVVPIKFSLYREKFNKI